MALLDVTALTSKHEAERVETFINPDHIVSIRTKAGPDETSWSDVKFVDGSDLMFDLTPINFTKKISTITIE